MCVLIDYLREDFSRLDALRDDNYSWIAHVGAYY